jgi:SiaC family regulatory phosphoprotein
MENYNIQATQNTPNIEGNIAKGSITIAGRCCPDDCVTFFQPFINWLKFFVISDQKQVNVLIDLDCFNTSSGLILFRILKDIKALSNSRQVDITWKYDPEDFDMMGVGKDFQYMLGDIIQMDPKVKKAS